MSATELLETQEKFHKVLEALSNPKFTINNDVYLEMLISHLSAEGNIFLSPVLENDKFINFN